MKPLNPCCQNCAHPIKDANHPICGFCIKKPPHFDRALIPYAFEEPLRGLLHQFKYYKGLHLTSFLTQLMGRVAPLGSEKPECLIPVPMHRKKLKQRGFNQAALLAKHLGKQWNIPYDLHSCKKSVNTEPQASLDGDQRQKNIRNAFFTKTLPYAHVAVIDDLLTTGSTANELARILKKSGVARVDIWCCARAVYE